MPEQRIQDQNGRLTAEVEVARKEIKTDNLSMSIGEIINLYHDGDIELKPAYQRLFRWDDEHKSKFIESIILGIPLPPIFVAQQQNAQWSVVDGLQRLSTILQLVGELNSEQGELVAPLVLTSTKKLPSLEGLTWLTLSEDVKRIIKRSKLNFNIILTENSIQAQYELFQRLNTGGLHLEPQEIRNCLIMMLNENFYEKLEQIKGDDSFRGSLNIQESKFSIEFHTELILRYFILKLNQINFDKYKMSSTLLSDFIDEETINLINNPNFNIDNEVIIFRRVFDLMYSRLRENAFKKFNVVKNEFEGPFNVSSFEAIVSGVALNIDNLERLPEKEFISKIQSVYQDPTFIELSSRGKKALPRIKGMIEFSRDFFQ
jgi:uncharacterized protein with ParB-like and HNH nuclease domain